MSAPKAEQFLAAMAEAEPEDEVARIVSGLPPGSPPTADDLQLSATPGEGLLFPVGVRAFRSNP